MILLPRDPSLYGYRAWRCLGCGASGEGDMPEDHECPQCEATCEHKGCVRRCTGALGHANGHNCAMDCIGTKAIARYAFKPSAGKGAE